MVSDCWVNLLEGGTSRRKGLGLLSCGCAVMTRLGKRASETGLERAYLSRKVGGGTYCGTWGTWASIEGCGLPLMPRTEGGGSMALAVPGLGLCLASGAILCGRTVAREGEAATDFSVLTAVVVATGLDAVMAVAFAVVGTCELDRDAAALLAVAPLVNVSSFLSSAGVPRGAGDPLAPRCSTGFGLGALSLIFGCVGSST